MPFRMLPWAASAFLKQKHQGKKGRSHARSLPGEVHGWVFFLLFSGRSRMSMLSSSSAFGLFGFISVLSLSTAHTTMAPHGPSSPQGSQSHSPPAAGVASATQTGTGTRPRPRPWSHRPQAPLGFCQRPQNRIYRPCTQIPCFHSALEGNYNHNHSLSDVLTWQEPCSQPLYLPITVAWGHLILCLALVYFCQLSWQASISTTPEDFRERNPEELQQTSQQTSQQTGSLCKGNTTEP